MAYSFQTFSVGQILTAALMNQVEINVRDHIHGSDSVSNILESSITDGSIFPRLGANETITGTWSFTGTGDAALQWYDTDGGGIVGKLQRDSAQGAISLYDDSGATLGMELLPRSTATSWIASKLAIGANVTADTTLHVYRGDSGGASHAAASMTIEDDTSHYLQFLSPNTEEVGIFFGDPQSSSSGQIRYNHTNDVMYFNTAGANSITINSSGQLVSTLATGTAPFSITSTTKVPNLNVEFVDSKIPGHSVGDIPINDTTLNSGLNAEQHNGLKVKVIDIGDWNMDASGGPNVAHGLDATKIRTVSVTVRDDTSTNYYPLDYTTDAGGGADSAGRFYWNGTNINLYRDTTDYFDNASFDSTSYNRGWITIWYVP